MNKMSLNSKLHGKTQQDREFMSVLLSVAPNKNDYYTQSGKNAFSNEYILKVPNNLSVTRDSTLLGTAFDYLARFRIAKFIKSQYVTSGLMSYQGMYKLKNVPTVNEYYFNKYLSWVEKVEKVVMGRSQLAELYEVAVRLAMLEQIARARINPNAVDLDYLFNNPVPTEVISELEMMIHLFEENFMIPEVIKKHSSVSFNPHFGVSSLLVEGADGDVYINGTLYDFKTTKDNSLKKKDNLQMIGYYLLDELSYYAGSEEFEFGDYYSVDRIAFYKARYGEIEYYDVQKHFTPETLKETLIELTKTFEGNEGNLRRYVGTGDVSGVLNRLTQLRNGSFEIVTLPTHS
ncbi:hypothetical protein EVJ20_13675 [Exiguobacterium sp. SH0S1]|uniref:hypothetical protein n=1 Tax=Exiguobacterium sp. SH0S1 TaxID=2510949 RepID=UPI00103E3E90|nr:hypothetical protein [Exiguobacterium sp. SH0S1]TCI75731.1 hypothetical protein EVJ20_13675 [Exiguobacterium sp. SH0S1]